MGTNLKNRTISTRRRWLAVLLAGVVGAACVGPVASLQASRRDRDLADAPHARRVPSDIRPSLKKAPYRKPRVNRDGCHVERGGDESPRCVYGNPDGNKTVVLFGDSHAAQWFPAMAKIAERKDWKLISLTKGACPSVDAPLPERTSDYDECLRWRDDSIRRIRTADADMVVITNHLHPNVDKDVWADGIRRTLRRLRGRKRVVLADSPKLRTFVPRCLMDHRRNPDACAPERHFAAHRAWSTSERRAARSAGARFVNVVPWLCPRGRTLCPVIAWDMLLYRDKLHITTVISRFLWPRLRNNLPSI